MKGKMTVIIAGTVGTMLVVTGFILPASARNSPRFIDAQKPNHVLFPPIRPNPIVFYLADHRDDPLHQEQAGKMRNSFPRNLGNVQREEVLEAIGTLDFNHLGGGAGNALRRGMIRIDRQGQTSNDEQNIQVQVNGVNGDSTVATVLIPNRYLNSTVNDHGRSQVTNLVRRALQNSFYTFIRSNATNYRLHGHLSN
jgi:hypothetical protein